MLARLQKSMKEKDQGFTLIELLVVIVIIGILAAIAIPVFLNQRKKGVDAGIKSDLKQLATIAGDVLHRQPGVHGHAPPRSPPELQADERQRDRGRRHADGYCIQRLQRQRQPPAAPTGTGGTTGTTRRPVASRRQSDRADGRQRLQPRRTVDAATLV